MRPVIVLDIDGVVAEGPEIKVPERTAERYAALALREPCVPRYLRQLTEAFRVYLVSARSFADADRTTLRWLEGHNALRGLMGVLVETPWEAKAGVARALKAVAVVDDDPRALEVCVIYCFRPPRPTLILMDSPAWTRNQEEQRFRRAHNWPELLTLLLPLSGG